METVISNLAKYRADLDALTDRGKIMHADLRHRVLQQSDSLDESQALKAKELEGTFEREYQRWYTEASGVIRQVLPSRLLEFEDLYKGDGKRKELNTRTYRIQDWMNGIRSSTNRFSGEKDFEDFAVAVMLFETQRKILASVDVRFESTLLEIRQLVQADLFDSELGAASELSKQGYRRGAGVVAGVVLERHLKQVADSHGIRTRKKSPTIRDVNDMLKKDGVLDVPTWRLVQHLSDVRNICAHDSDREPAEAEIVELVDQVGRLCKTLF